MTKEEIYDAQIAPLMTQIIGVAQAHGIAMVASFAIPSDEDENLLATTLTPDGDGDYLAHSREFCRAIGAL